MKVLVVSNLYPPHVRGGYELSCRRMVHALQRRGHEVIVLTSAPPRLPRDDREPVRRLLHLTAIYESDRLARMAPVTRLLCEADSYFVQADNVYALASIIEEERPHVAYLWNLIGIGGLGLVGTLHHTATPWVWQLGDAVPSYLCSYRGRSLPTLARELERLEGRYIACSTHVVGEIRDNGVDLQNVRVLPNSVHTVPQHRAAYLPDGVLRMVSAGEVAPHKGTGIIVDMAARLCEQGRDNFTIDLFGRVTDPSIPTLVARYGLDEKIRFRGQLRQAELVQLYGNYDVFLFPTWEREPFGVVAIEAAAAGCVPLVTSTCGVAEWLVAGVHCLKARRSPEAFADQVVAVLDGSVDLAAIGRRAAALVNQEYAVDAVAEEVERELMAVAARSTTRPDLAREAYALATIAERIIHEGVEESA